MKLPAGEDSALLPSLLTLSDVFPTGHHCAVTAGVGPRTSVTVIGDGAVGLSAVLAARRLGAERIILMGRHPQRTDLGREFGATEVVAERGAEGVERVRELTGGDGTHTVLECVGLRPAIETAFGVVRDGGVVSRVGAPQDPEVPMGFDVFLRNITLTGGVAPARAYIEQLLPEVLGRRDRARPGLRPHRRPARRARRLPGDGRPGGTQGPRPPLSAPPARPFSAVWMQNAVIRHRLPRSASRTRSGGPATRSGARRGFGLRVLRAMTLCPALAGCGAGP